MSVLVTGGLGYIGSNVIVSLIFSGFSVIILDNLSNSENNVLKKIYDITGTKPIFYKGDVCDRLCLEDIFLHHSVHFVIHLAGLKAVGSSVSFPLTYYSNNVLGSVNLFSVMSKFNCKKIIFSSSATVYGQQTYPVDENSPTGIGITNPYGRTKFMIEEILKDLYISDNSWSIVILRYFNPIGTTKSGLLNENPKEVPNNLFPYLVRVASGTYQELKIFGNDYETKDGTCVRDYIHIEDLSLAHVASMKKLTKPGVHVYNIGSGVGMSVLQLIATYEKVNKVKIAYSVVQRRIGDQPIVYAKVEKAKRELDWCCLKTLEEMCFVPTEATIN